MAVVATITGAVPLPKDLAGTSTQPNSLRAYLVKVVIQSADYSTGFLTATILTATGGTSIVGVSVIQATVAAGTTLLGFGVWDAANTKVRFLTAITNQTTATDYTAVNGDIFTLLVIVN